MKEISIVSAPSESHFHKAIKLFLYKYIYENNSAIIERSLEKYYGNRIADIYFRLNNGKEIVVEVQNSKITISEIIQRSKDYNEKGIYILWILHGEGNCVETYKYPVDSFEIKISLAESFLHKMYGGRVYYINLNIHNERVTLSNLFALHFSKPICKKKRGFFRTRYTTYLFRDSNYTEIQNWNIFCTEFSGFKIARFYDKNVKSILKKRIASYYHLKKDKFHNEKKLYKAILKHFKRKYGRYLILNTVIDLINENKIIFHYKITRKIQKKLL
ncbi:MAG: competence protein CoiA family protein [Candidatus Thorarchaeota archaeon]